MKNNEKKKMKLVNASSGKMICSTCGHEHYANVRPNANGQYYKEAWNCPNCNQ